jgi:endonuclease/exonuclease/phosphatase family metal-dependent hydrolase
MSLAPQSSLTHQLGSELLRLGAIRRRRQLERDPGYLQNRPEIERLLAGFDWDLTPAAPPAGPRPQAGDRVRVVSWNIERGKRFEPLCAVLGGHPELSQADVLLLNEVDLGMGRSGNLHVARELARLLGMRYVFCNSHLVLSPGDSAERDHGMPNRLGLHGNAVLSRFPITRFEAVVLPELTDKFEVLEKRLGEKRALICDLDLPDGPLRVAAVHLDPFASSRHRAAQLDRILSRLLAAGPARLLLGGDLNTNTYDFGSPLGLAANLAHKATVFGFDGTIRQYMTPEQVYERPVFETLRRAGLEVERFNDVATGTIYYDVNDPELSRKTLDYVPRFAWRYLQRRLRPWGGVVPLRLDWFAGRGLTPTGPGVLERPTWEGQHVSDHNPIWVDLKLQG